jgi:ribosomal protein S18 acetylase RimI-like enzyme
MDVRLATLDDAGHLVAAYMTAVNPSRREAERFARLHVGLDRALLAEDGGIVVAGLTWGVRDDPRAGLAQITGLLVNDRMRRRGFGTLLALLALEDMDAVLRSRGGKLRRAFVLADQADLPIRRLWEKVGFRAGAQIPNHVKLNRVEVLYALHPGAM